jgi:hypothetical protein
MWGLLPIGSSILAIFFEALLRDKATPLGDVVAITSPSHEDVYVEANS